MAVIFRILVILGIVYLARFILGHKHQTQTEVDRNYDFHSQRRESSNVLEDSNEELLIESDILLDRRTRYNSEWPEDPEIEESNENAPIRYGVPVSGRTFQDADEFDEEDLIEESMEQMSSKEKLTIHREAWSEEDRKEEPFEGRPSKEKISTQYRGYVFEEDNIAEPNKENPSNEKVLIESGAPLRSRTIPHTAWSEEDKIVNSNRDSSSNKEKVLIDSAAPLRGRTIHHTAWSEEEDKIVESVVDKPTENDDKRVYDSWSLTKAFNYILSFIYDVEEEGAIVETLPEDAVQTLKSQNQEFYEMLLLQSQNILEKPKETAVNKSNYNQNKDRGTPPNSRNAYASKQKTRLLESWDGDFKNGDDFIDYPYEDEESLYEDSDFEYEDDFNLEFVDERPVDVLQRSQPKDTDLKTPNTNTVNVVKYTNESEYMITVSEKEYVPTTQSSKVNDHKKIKKHSSVTKSPKLDEIGNKEIQESRTEAANDYPPRDSEKSTTDEHSMVIAKPFIDTNKGLKGDPANENENILSHLEKQKGEVVPIVKESHTYKTTGNDAESKEETPKYLAELENYAKASQNSEKTALELPCDKENILHPVSEDIKNESKTATNSAVKHSVRSMTAKSVPTTPSSHKRHSEMRKEEVLGTKRKFDNKSPTIVPKSLHQYKESASKLNDKVVNQKTITPVTAKDNRGNKHEVNSIQTADFKNEAQNPNHGTGTVKSNTNTEQLESQLNKKKNIGGLPNAHAQGPKKQTTENGIKHSKPKITELRDMYPDFGATENVASYNYILDSGEFIKIDENGSKKVNKKQNDYSDSVKRHGVSGKPTHISSGPTTSPKAKNEDGVFETILEYLYKYTNSSYLLALREHNSTES